MAGEVAARMDLRDRLGRLYSLLERMKDANASYEAVMSRYLPQDKPLRKQWGDKPALIYVVLFIVFILLVNISVELYLIAIMGAVLVSLVGGVTLLVRGGPAKRFAWLLFGAAALTFICLVGRLVFFDGLMGLLVVASLTVMVVLAVRIRNVYVSVANERIVESNQSARDAALNRASSELAPIRQEVSDIQHSYNAEGYQEWFPKKYLTMESVSAMWHIVNDARADTIKDAVNLYIQDCHNQHMRQAADQQTAIAQMQLEEQRRTTRSVQTAAMLNLGMQAFQGSLTRSTLRSEGAMARSALQSEGGKIAGEIRRLRG